MQWWWSSKRGEQRNERSVLFSPCYEAIFYIGFAPEGLLKRQMDFYGKNFSLSLALPQPSNSNHRTVQVSFHMYKPAVFCFTSTARRNIQGYQGVENSCQRACRDSVKVCALLVSSTRIIRTRLVHVARMGERRGAYRRSLRKRYHLEGIIVHGRIALKWIFKKCDGGHVVAQLVEALRYKPGCRRFDYRRDHWNFSLT